MARTPPARTAGQRPLIALVALVVLAIGGTSLVGELAGRDAGAGAGTPDVPAAGQVPEEGRSAEVVGPVRGADVAAYVDDRTAALLDAPPTVDTAVVSFTDRLRVQDALMLVGDGAEVRAVLVRLPGELAVPQTIRVAPEEDPVAVVQAALADTVDPLRREQAELRELLDSGTVDDEEFEAEYERRVAAIDEALAAVEGDGALVHAVVVRADVERLRELRDTTAVRLVDPAPPGTDIGLSVFHGLLPSDTGTVTFGRAA